MTNQELKDYLKNAYFEIESYRLNIRSLEYYKEKTVSKFPSNLAREQLRLINGYILKDRQQLERKVATITAWSKLIHNETRRTIFLDHYINGLTWKEVKEKYHYSRSQVFEINKRNCQEITDKLVCDIVPKCNNEAVTI